MKTCRWHSVSAAVAMFAAAGTALAQPGSNLCGSAPVITPGTYTGTTAGATRDGSAGCGNSANSPDVWYQVTPSENRTLLLELCGSSYDTVVSVHSACPGTEENQVACNDDGCGLSSIVGAPVVAGSTYYIRISGYNGATGAYTLDASFQEPPPPGSGPDVVYADINGIQNYGAVGSVAAFAYGTDTCNRGATNLTWNNGGTPGVGFNLYRLHSGRMMQVGQSWVKIACCAAAGSGCGLACNGQGGNVLGAGCLDVYGAGYNGGHFGLKPRSSINAYSGQFAGSAIGGTGTLDRRLQVQTADLSGAGFPGALYFAEGVYVATDEEPEKKLNNASHRRVTISGTSMSLAAGSVMEDTVPAIYAWRDHGLGVNTPDPAVVIQEVDVPDEGRFIVAHKVKDNGNGTWRYEYAVFNLNSHLSGGSLSVPVNGATVTNVGFNDVPYHSGEPYDNTDWATSVSADAVTWSSPQTFAQNPNSNALRWGTMYNFWFDADQPPADTDATLGLFRPATPGSVAFSVGAPAGGGECAVDWNGDETVNSSDISSFLTAWLASVTAPDVVADFNEDGTTNSSDISAFLTAWLDAVVNGC